MLLAMRRLFTAAALIIFALECFPQPLISQPYEGSREEAQVLADIDHQAQNLGYDSHDFSIQKKDAYHSFSHVLLIHVPGRSQRVRSIILPISMVQGLEPDAYDAAQAKSLALDLLSRLHEIPPFFSLDILIVGAHTGIEDGLGIQFIQDSNLLIASEAIMEFTCFVPGKTWRIDLDNDRTNIPSWLYKLTLSSFAGESGLIESPTMDFVRKSLIGGQISWGKAAQTGGLPWIVLKSSNVDSKNVLTSSSIEVLEHFLSEPVSDISADSEYNYLPVLLGNHAFIITEMGSVSVFIMWVSAVLLLLFRRNRRKAYLVSLWKGLPQVLLIAGLWFVSLTFALICNPFSLGAAEHSLNVLLIVLRLLSAILVFLLLRLVFVPLFPNQGSFYSASALVMAFLGLVCGVAFNIRLTLPLLVSDSFLIVSMILRNRHFKTLSWFVSTSIVLGMVCISFGVRSSAPRPEEISWIFDDALGLNLIMFIVSLPGLFQCFRIRLLWNFKRKHRLIRTLGICMAILALVLGGYSLIRSPQQKITSSENSGGAEILSIEQLADQGIRIQSKARLFLKRELHTIRITSNEELRGIDLWLDSDSGLTVYSCNFPFTYDNNQKIHIKIGRNPSLPLQIDLVLPQGVKVGAHLEVQLAGLLNMVREERFAAWDL